MKIFAGLVLKGRNPRHEPARIAVSSALEVSAMVSVTSSSDSEQIADTPHDRPSSPSMRLMALVSPTIQKIVTGISSHPSVKYVPKKLMNSIVTSCHTAMNATAICTISLIHELSWNTSSNMPSTHNISPPNHSAVICGV